MATETCCGQVDILVLDLAAEEQVQGSLDQLGLLSAAEAAQRRVALITAVGLAVEVEDLVVLSERLAYNNIYHRQGGKSLTSSFPPYFNAMAKTLPRILG